MYKNDFEITSTVVFKWKCRFGQVYTLWSTISLNQPQDPFTRSPKHQENERILLLYFLCLASATQYFLFELHDTPYTPSSISPRTKPPLYARTKIEFREFKSTNNFSIEERKAKLKIVIIYQIVLVQLLILW